MARTVQEIKTQMTDAFMADQTIRERYGLREGDTFSSRFSVASLESILFFIVASAHYVLERIFDQFKADVIKQINSSVVATIPWYHQQALSYQHGDRLELDEITEGVYRFLLVRIRMDSPSLSQRTSFAHSRHI